MRPEWLLILGVLRAVVDRTYRLVRYYIYLKAIDRVLDRYGTDGIPVVDALSSTEAGQPRERSANRRLPPTDT